MNTRAFTLIELLIAVAIIAILAAIAVPNFLEAQTRAKVSRIAADMRTLRTAIEAYQIDNNAHPETDFGQDLGVDGSGPLRLTSPIAYITEIPRSPFDEHQLGHHPDYPQHAQRNRWPLYIRARVTGVLPSMGDPINPEVDSDYVRDRLTYLYFGNSSLAGGGQYEGEWALKSVGPDSVDDRNGMDSAVTSILLARIYDPTNGTRSRGDILVYSDDQGLAVRND